MSDSFLKSIMEAKGVSFLTPIPFEEIEKLSNCKILTSSNEIFVYYKSYSDFHFFIEYETIVSNSFLFKKKKYLMKSIFIQDEFNHFERIEMLKFVCSLIKDTNYKFNVIAGGFFPEYDSKSYGFSDLQNNSYIK